MSTLQEDEVLSAPKGGVANLTNAGKGRKPGVPNRTTRRTRDAIATALTMTAPDIAGWLRHVGQEDPRQALQFATALARVAMPRPAKCTPDAEGFRGQYAPAREPAISEVGRRGNAPTPLRLNLTPDEPAGYADGLHYNPMDDDR